MGEEGSTKCSKCNTYANRIPIVLQNVHPETALGHINEWTVTPTQHILICYTHWRLGRFAPRAKVYKIDLCGPLGKILLVTSMYQHVQYDNHNSSNLNANEATFEPRLVHGLCWSRGMWLSLAPTSIRSLQ